MASHGALGMLPQSTSSLSEANALCHRSRAFSIDPPNVSSEAATPVAAGPIVVDRVLKFAMLVRALSPVVSPYGSPGVRPHTVSGIVF
ncbi:Uncharacterised protein [Mycobacteroides abscessus subsp. massiliense]|nr:Uncharacterised protein [Mycobacteroides abscessus subsp. massiliense]